MVLAIKTKFSSREKELDLHLDRRVRMPLFSELFAAATRAFRLFAVTVEEAVDRTGQAHLLKPLFQRLAAAMEPLR